MKIAVVTILALARTCLAQAPLDYSPADEALKVVRLATDDRESLRAVRVDPRGRIFVGGRQAVFVYEPNARGGYLPRQELFRFPTHAWVHDLEFRGDDLYVLTANALYRLAGGVTRCQGLKAEKLVWGLPLEQPHFGFHALAWGPEGDLYLSMGDPLWHHGDRERPDHWGHWTFLTAGGAAGGPVKVPCTGVGGVFRCRPDGSAFQVVARGLRNPCGLAFDRHFRLFTSDNDHESVPERYVPGRLVHVTPHAYLGWPRGWMAEKTPERADLLQTMCEDLGRFVPVGLAYYHEAFLPEEYRDNLLVARWCTRSIMRYPLQPRGASLQTAEEALLVGKGQARPLGVCVGRGGRLFATIGFMANKEHAPLYRSDLVVLTRSDDKAHLPFDGYDITTAQADKLWRELSDPSWHRRYRAHQEILRRGGVLLKEANRRLNQAEADDPAVPHLVWLSAASGAGSLHLTARADDADPMVRLQAVRALTEYPEQLRHYPLLVKRLLDEHPQVQHAALLAFFNPKLDFADAARHVIVRHQARSQDTYLRQAAALLLAEKSSVKQLTELCESHEVALRLAGVLAVGFRLTLPPATRALDPEAPLAPFRHPEANVAQLADGKLDLRSLGRLGAFTVAEHWKAGPRTAEQETLFTLLRGMLRDSARGVRWQAAQFLSLLADPRSEAEVAKVLAR